ncbi:hypothetical protein [Actinomadura sediminis]|uniref:Uncharacterized protein n=1 Tax=Actinomadura sediminis TaxID=1038904 RepID=A0ABW3ELC9_9ACTN
MLLDELGSGLPGLLAELNQALSIRSCAFAGGMVRARPDVWLVATADTYGAGGIEPVRLRAEVAVLGRGVYAVDGHWGVEEVQAVHQVPEVLADVRGRAGASLRSRFREAFHGLPEPAASAVPADLGEGEACAGGCGNVDGGEVSHVHVDAPPEAGDGKSAVGGKGHVPRDAAIHDEDRSGAQKGQDQQ